MRTVEDILYQVARAQGMVSVQADCGVGDALVLMCERAQVQHQTLTQIADAVVDRTIRFGFTRLRPSVWADLVDVRPQPARAFGLVALGCLVGSRSA